MLQNGKPVQSLWLGGEKFDKIATKLKSYIGTQVYVQTTDSIKDLDIQLDHYTIGIKPQKDGAVSVTKIIWDGDHGVDLIGLVDVHYDVLLGSTSGNSPVTTSQASTDLCIIGHESI